MTYRFLRGRPQSRKSTSGMDLSDSTRFRRRKSICVPNFDEIIQSTSEIKLLPVSKNGRQPYWNSTSDFDFDLILVISVSFCIDINILQNRTTLRGVMTTYPLSKMAAGSHTGFDLGDIIPPTKYNCRYQLGPQI